MILLTGNSGFLGKSIVRNLSAKKISFLSIGRNIHSDIVCDLSIKIPIISKEIIDLVVHAAGKAHSIPKTSFEKIQFYEDNIKSANKNGLNIDISTLKDALVLNVGVSTENIDALEGALDSVAKIELTLSGNDTQTAFNQFLESHLYSLKYFGQVIVLSLYQRVCFE